MCVTDLDKDLDIAEDEQALRPGPHPMGGPHPLGGRYAGVAWGLAERSDAPDLGEARTVSPS